MFKLYLIAFPLFFAVDLAWVGLVAKNFYQAHIGAMLRPNVEWIPAVVFYLLFVAGLVVFVIAPAVQAHSWKQALLLGAFFGLITYGTFDLTNQALIKDWPLLVTIVDLCYGMAIAAIISVFTVLIAEKFVL